jgi:hypothetical protein
LIENQVTAAAISDLAEEAPAFTQDEPTTGSKIFGYATNVIDFE